MVSIATVDLGFVVNSVVDFNLCLILVCSFCFSCYLSMLVAFVCYVCLIDLYVCFCLSVYGVRLFVDRIVCWC